MFPNNLDTPLVQGEPMGGAATPAAPTTPAGPVAPATPPATPADAEAQKVRLLETQLAKYESDIRALKSTSDRRYSEAEKQWKQQQEQLRRELEMIKVSGMDEDQRKQYEANLNAERQNDALREVEQAKQVAAEYQATMQAMSYFTQNGVPIDKLTLDQGYDALFNSGMNWLTEEVKRTRTSQPPATPQQPHTTLPTPPTVATNSGVVVKPSWDDLRSKYGNDENIYRLVEAGLLSSDIIPS